MQLGHRSGALAYLRQKLLKPGFTIVYYRLVYSHGSIVRAGSTIIPTKTLYGCQVMTVLLASPDASPAVFQIERQEYWGYDSITNCACPIQMSSIISKAALAVPLEATYAILLSNSISANARRASCAQAGCKEVPGSNQKISALWALFSMVRSVAPT